MPTLRAISISSLVSIVKVTMPSTSPGFSPASSSAALTASQASCSSLRPDSLENSVWPMPAIAALPASVVASCQALLPSEQADGRGPRNVVAEAVAPGIDLDEPSTVAALGPPVTVPVKRSGSSGNAGTPSRIANFFTIASGPAQSVRNRTHSPLVVRMFMNMLGEPCFLRELGIVVHRHEVAGRDRAGDDDRCGDRDLERGDLVADVDVAPVHGWSAVVMLGSCVGSPSRRSRI